MSPAAMKIVYTNTNTYIHILNITNLSTMFTILVLTQTAAASNLIFNVIIIGWVGAHIFISVFGALNLLNGRMSVHLSHRITHDIRMYAAANWRQIETSMWCGQMQNIPCVNGCDRHQSKARNCVCFWLWFTHIRLVWIFRLTFIHIWDNNWNAFYLLLLSKPH